MSEELPTDDRETGRALHLWVVLARAHRAVSERARRDILSRGMSLTEFGVLEMLYHRGPTPLHDIARRLLMATGSVTYVVDALVREGTVVREPCPKDRRVQYAVLTEAGRARLDAVFPGHAAVIAEALGGLNAEEQDQAASLLRKLGLWAAEGHGDEP
ncbi:MAG: MarR family transcriptional regulator [Armatimonadetes bacterium]|nr:MarR family transcriptional regulator [Armatimonadota bacterium]MDE2206081.1 MarR family transcriptional regulator [Armatimonadota bacterium]